MAKNNIYNLLILIILSIYICETALGDACVDVFATGKEVVHSKRENFLKNWESSHLAVFESSDGSRELVVVYIVHGHQFDSAMHAHHPRIPQYHASIGRRVVKAETEDLDLFMDHGEYGKPLMSTQLEVVPIEQLTHFELKKGTKIGMALKEGRKINVEFQELRLRNLSADTILANWHSIDGQLISEEVPLRDLCLPYEVGETVRAPFLEGATGLIINSLVSAKDPQELIGQKWVNARIISFDKNGCFAKVEGKVQDEIFKNTFRLKDLREPYRAGQMASLQNKKGGSDSRFNVRIVEVFHDGRVRVNWNRNVTSNERSKIVSMQDLREPYRLADIVKVYLGKESGRWALFGGGAYIRIGEKWSEGWGHGKITKFLEKGRVELEIRNTQYTSNLVVDQREL